MKRWTLLATLLASAWTSSAAAETCTVRGTYRYEPTDLYNCDSTYMNCAGWLAADHDQKRGASAARVRYARIRIRNSANTTTFATTHTDSTGFFSTTFSSDLLGAGAQCEGGRVTILLDFMRVDERDLAAAAPRYRFRLVDRNDTLRQHIRDNYQLATAGNTTTASHDLPATTPETNQLAHYYAVYNIMDSAIGEAVLWSTNIRDRLTSSVAANQQSVVMDELWQQTPTTEASSSQRGKIWMHWGMYRAGGVLRHELGHWLHQLIHNQQQARGPCVDGRYPTNLPPPPPVGEQQHGVTTCEFGYLSTLEGMATFIGVRTATSADTNVWLCLSSLGTLDGCSIDIAANTNGVAPDDSDGVTPVWQVIGDRWADRASRCTIPDSTSCGCGANCGTQASKNALGYRIETQVARFMWDLIDTSSDSGAVDDVDYSMGQLVGELQGMACSTANLGAENSCNEATLAGGSCARDKYNAYDIAARLSTNESQERTLNCVATALD